MKLGELERKNGKPNEKKDHHQCAFKSQEDREVRKASVTGSERSKNRERHSREELMKGKNRSSDFWKGVRTRVGVKKLGPMRSEVFSPLAYQPNEEALAERTLKGSDERLDVWSVWKGVTPTLCCVFNRPQ